MKLVKLLLSLISIVGLISMCGCVGSNADSGAPTTTNSNKEYAEYGTVEVVKQQPYSSVSTNPDDYKSWIPGNPSEIHVIVANYMSRGNIVSMNGSDYISCISTIDKTDLIRMALDQNITDIYNKTKYQKQYEQYAQVLEELKKWQLENIHGKIIVEAIYSDKPGHYEIYYNGGRNLEEDLVSMGYIYIPKKTHEYFIKNADKNMPGLVEKHEILWKLQEDAKKNKRGIWSIEFNN